MFDHFKKMQSLAAFEKKGTETLWTWVELENKIQKIEQTKKTNESI